MAVHLRLFNTVDEFNSAYTGEEYIEPWVSYTWANEHVDYNKASDPFNGHGYVDLGLPSGTLWATCNVGASSPDDYGDYFAWAETEPKSSYTFENYKYAGAEWPEFTKYNSDGAELEMSDDAARVNMGGEWQMPSSAQCQELLDNTTQEDTTVNNIAGTLYTSTANGNTMFIPKGGWIEDSSIMYRGDVMRCMSRVLSHYMSDVVLKFGGSSIDEMNGGRQNGNTIRAVINPSE